MTDASRSCDSNTTADVVCPNFIHTTHIYTVCNMLFRGFSKQVKNQIVSTQIVCDFRSTDDH